MPEFLVDFNTIQKPVAILFDWDGVLVDTKDLIKDAYLETFKAMGQAPLEIDTLHQLPGTSLRDLFPKIFGQKALDAEKVFYAYIHANHLSQLRAMAGGLELLKTIFAAGIPMGVISNKRGDILRKEVQHLHYQGYFVDVVGSKDLSEDKPSTVPVSYVLSKMGLAASPSIWFVGDWKADMECAHRAGLTPVLFHNPTLKKPGPQGFPPKIYVESCLDLKNLFNQYMKGE